MEKIISDSNASTLTYNSDTNIVTKKLKQWQIDPTGFELYKEIQKTNPNIVKVYDKIDDYTFTMEYIPNIITTLEDLLLFYEVPYPEEYKKELLQFTKNDIINITESEVNGALIKGSMTLKRTMNPAALDPTERNAVTGIEVP